MNQSQYTSLGHSIPARRFGPLNERSNLIDDGESLRAAMAADGYLLLRSVLNPSEVLAAREEVFSRLMEVGEIKAPAIEGRPTGTSQRAELYPDLGAFWRSVCEGPALRRVTHSGPMLEIMARLLGGP
ncbi:MAG: hypothetical protein IT367_05415, partial [Candidatus Hydrogenedentes bacterium]|nr:hypothetical protein [Candidatus Hydrogenedentota bacterium]